jgi:hypothetical protein
VFGVGVEENDVGDGEECVDSDKEKIQYLKPSTKEHLPAHRLHTTITTIVMTNIITAMNLYTVITFMLLQLRSQTIWVVE